MIARSPLICAKTYYIVGIPGDQWIEKQELWPLKINQDLPGEVRVVSVHGASIYIGPRHVAC